MLLSPDDELLLECYFGGTVLSFERSSMGGMLEMQAGRYRDSDGKRVLRPEDPWLCIHLNETRCEAGYEPDLEAILWLARVSRRLDAVGRASPVARAAIELYYGAQGAFWKRILHQQEWALVDLTATGAAMFRERKARAVKLDRFCADTAASELATEVELQLLTPNPERGAKLAAVADEIQRLMSLIVSSWNQTDARGRAA